MNSEKGITLITLIIYVILLILVLGILSTVSNHFYENMGHLDKLGKSMPIYNKFTMYFLEDVKNNSDAYIVQSDQILFEDGTLYTYDNNNIYRNKVKICEDISAVTFSIRDEIDENDFTKKVITVYMMLEGTDVVEFENDFVLKYW